MIKEHRLIHQALISAQVAVRYYAIKYPEREYDNMSARKQFAQDANIDKDILRKVIDKIFKEQQALLK